MSFSELNKNTGIYRANWHDYRSKAIYHITLLKSPDMPAFGSLAGDCSVPVGKPGSSYIECSPLGTAIKGALREIGNIHRALRLYQYALMPDHLHMLISVEEELDDILGRKIAIFKNIVNKKSCRLSVFTKGFNDQILTKKRNLNVIYNYIRSNPYRLAVRRKYPDYFERRENIIINGAPYQAYGNFQLLDNPFKEQVIVHRSDNLETHERNRQIWLHTVANGGVLVSPFISTREKEVRKEAEELNGRVILISSKPLGEREKPTGQDFYQCSRGRLLIIAPLQTMAFSRETCLKLNLTAESIVCAI